MQKKAIFLGECMIELNGDICSLGKSNTLMEVNFGGDTYNSAVYFSRLTNKNTNTFYCTALSKDSFSKKMMERFKLEKINCDLVRTDGKNPPGLYSIEINKKGERSFLYWRDQSPTKYIFLGSKGKRLLNDIKNSDIFYYSGISIGILDVKQKEQLIQVGSTANICGFDFNFRHQLHHDRKKSQVMFKEINNHVDINFISYDDVKQLFNTRNPYEIFNLLNNENNLILLRYKDLIIFKKFDQEIKSIKLPKGEAVDTTAAGDAFNGSFLALMNNNKHASIEENVFKSHAVTREVIKYKGAIIKKHQMPKLR